MRRLVLLIAPLLLPAAAVYALDVAGYDSATNDRFSSGYPAAPIPNSSPKFIGKDFDWSGVGWWKKDPHFSVTLLGSKNFACTRHMEPQTGDAITFLGRDGHLHDYHVAKIQLVPLGSQNGQPVYADTAVGTFAETVAYDDQIAHYPVAFSPKGLASFIGRKIMMYGHMARLGTNEIVEGIMLENVASQYNFDTSGLTPGMSKCESGDSGSPSFIVIDGKLALVGTHWKVDSDSMVSGVIPGMNAVMAADGTRVEVLPLAD